MNRILALWLAVVALPLSAAEQPAFTAAMITAAERSDYARTSTLAEVVAVLDALDEAGELALSKLKRDDLDDDEAVERALGRAVRRAAERAFGRRPVIDVTVLRS